MLSAGSTTNMYNIECIAIKDIRNGLKNINVIFIVLEVGAVTFTKEQREVRTFKVADPTACINLSVWDEPGKLLIPGDIVRLTRGYACVWRQCLTLYSGKNGEIHKIDDFCLNFNEYVNMSEPIPNYVMPPISINNSTSNNNNNTNSVLNNGIANNNGPMQQQQQQNRNQSSIGGPINVSQANQSTNVTLSSSSSSGNSVGKSTISNILAGTSSSSQITTTTLTSTSTTASSSSVATATPTTSSTSTISTSGSRSTNDPQNKTNIKGNIRGVRSNQARMINTKGDRSVFVNGRKRHK